VPRPHELFLSHANIDRRFVRKLAAVLRREGVSFWYSEKHIVGAQQWHDEIGKALQRCDWFAVVLSPAAVASRWVKWELLYALNHNRYEGRIVPIVLKLCDQERLSWTLDGFQRVDFSSRFEDGCDQLLRVWGIRQETSAILIGARAKLPATPKMRGRADVDNPPRTYDKSPRSKKRGNRRGIRR
jgi:TIR domain-containing protein